MNQNKPESDPRYDAFVRRAVQSRMVYTLQDADGFYAERPSEAYDDLGEPVPVYCFWDSAEDAEACRGDEWEDYTVTLISLDDFMNEILLDMDEDYKLAGVAFDEELYGTEIEPVDLLGDLLNEIRLQNQIHEYPDYADLQAYREDWLAEAAAGDKPVIH